MEENKPISEEHRAILNESARLLAQNRPGEAATRLLELQKEYPGDADIAINLGGAHILQRRWDRAVKVLRKALDAHPRNVMLWTNLAAAELGVLETSGPKQQERAIAAYHEALAVDPVAPNVHYHLGLIYKERGELLRASAFFQRALEVHPYDRDAEHWLKQIEALTATGQTSSGKDDASAKDATAGEN